MSAPLKVLLVWILIVIALVVVVFVRYDIIGGIKNTLLSPKTEQAAAPQQAGQKPEMAAPATMDKPAENVASNGSPDLANGKKLFEEKTCALCHGADGTASSPMGQQLNATNLATLKFHNNKNNLPAEAYIIQVIENGVPGTGMVSFKSQIPNEKDRKDVAQYVLSLGKK